MTHSIGIDFGTTKTLVSYYDPSSQNNGYVRLGRGVDKMPSSVFVGEDGVWQFGDDADDFMSQYPSRYRRDFKLGLGKTAPYLVAKINGKIQQFTAKDLVAKFLQNIKEQCEETVFHEPVTSCTITYPVAFSIAQCNELEAAAIEAGFEDVQLLPEPEAAGYAYYRFGVDRRLSRLMVVDWGGGTVDFAMIALDGDVVGLVPDSYGGAVDVGGRKFDELLFSHLSRKIMQSGGGCLADDGDPQLSKHICNCKEKLSRVVAVKQVVLVGGKGVYRTEVGRDEFNIAISPVVEKVVEQLKELLSRCVDKPQALLLIGGSSSIPFVRERLQAATGLQCVVWDRLNEAVAIGAAWYGSEPTGSDDPSDAAEMSNVALPVPIVQQRCWKSGSELEAYIRGRKALYEDYLYLLRSTIAATWRLNSIQISALAFADELEKIGENEDPKIVSIRVRQGLAAIELEEFGDMVNGIADCAAESFKGGTGAEGYIELYPELKSISVRTVFSGVNLQSIKNEVMNQLRQMQYVYGDVCQKYNMLCEGFTRYDKIMAGGSLWQNALLGGALGLLTGGIGVIAAVAWSGWGHMNDKDFVQNYSNAIQNFLATCDAFTDQGQKLLSQIVMSRQDMWNQSFKEVEAYLRALNAEGLDLNNVEKRLDEKEKNDLESMPNAVQVNQVLALALQLLKQDAPISESRIQRIVEKLRKCGALLSEDGAFDETAAQALVPADASGDDAVNRFRQIVGACEHFDCFYILEAIPRDKLVNALHDYGVGLSEENVLCLYDSTFFGGGGDGFMIAPGGICSKQLGCDPYAWTWNEIRNICPNVNGRIVHINGVDVDVPFGGAVEFAEMFRKLKSLLG